MKKKDATESSMLKDRVCAVCGNKFDVKLLEKTSSRYSISFQKNSLRI
jgi:hypothetical protein